MVVKGRKFTCPEVSSGARDVHLVGLRRAECTRWLSPRAGRLTTTVCNYTGKKFNRSISRRFVSDLCVLEIAVEEKPNNWSSKWWFPLERQCSTDFFIIFNKSFHELHIRRLSEQKNALGWTIFVFLIFMDLFDFVSLKSLSLISSSKHHIEINAEINELWKMLSSLWKYDILC